MNSEIRFRVLKLIEEHPQITQRDLASRLGVSLGKVNYCVRALVEKGFIKVRNFKNSGHKRQYMYQLTPSGVTERTRMTIVFLRLKSAEFDEIRSEIDRLEARLTAGEVKI